VNQSEAGLHRERIAEIVADVLGLDPAFVTDDCGMETAENWDSLNHLRIISAVEQELGLTLTMEEIRSANSLSKLIQLVQKRTTAG
jgi:acyl carrier protein